MYQIFEMHFTYNKCHIIMFVWLRIQICARVWFKQRICPRGFWDLLLFVFEMTESSYVLVGDEEERFFGLDAESIPDSADSGGVNQYLTESYDPSLLLSQTDAEENVKSTGDSSSQMPLTPCQQKKEYFVTETGYCLHDSKCHHGKRREVLKHQVKICKKCLANGVVTLESRCFCHVCTQKFN